MNPLQKARESLNLRKSEAARLCGLDRAAYVRIEAKMEKGLRGTTPERADLIAKAMKNLVTRDMIMFPSDYVLTTKAPGLREYRLRCK